MQLGAFYIWTYTYHLIRRAGTKHAARIEDEEENLKKANTDVEANETSLLLNGTEHVRKLPIVEYIMQMQYNKL